MFGVTLNPASIVISVRRMNDKNSPLCCGRPMSAGERGWAQPKRIWRCDTCWREVDLDGVEVMPAAPESVRTEILE